VLAPRGDETLALRALVRTREDLVGARVALANLLRAQLDVADQVAVGSAQCLSCMGRVGVEPTRDGL
jgi:hypothetical protein